MTTRRQPMTPLRQRLWEDMQIPNYSPSTIDSSLRCVTDFARYFHASPEHLGPEHGRTSQLFLIQEKQRAWSTVVQAVCALRFFSRVTLKRPGMIEYIAHPRRPFTLPTILSQAEVAAVLTALPNLKHRAILTPSLPLACGWPNCASGRSRTSTAPAWSCRSGKAKGNRIARSCSRRNCCHYYASIGSRTHRGRGSFRATPARAP